MYHKTANIRYILVVNKIVDHSDVVGASLLKLHLHYRLVTWLQFIEQRHMQDETRNISALGFVGLYIWGWTIIKDMTSLNNRWVDWGTDVNRMQYYSVLSWPYQTQIMMIMAWYMILIALEDQRSLLRLTLWFERIGTTQGDTNIQHIIPI